MCELLTVGPCSPAVGASNFCCAVTRYITSCGSELKCEAEARAESLQEEYMPVIPWIRLVNFIGSELKYLGCPNDPKSFLTHYQKLRRFRVFPPHCLGEAFALGSTLPASFWQPLHELRLDRTIMDFQTRTLDWTAHLHELTTSQSNIIYKFEHFFFWFVFCCFKSMYCSFGVAEDDTLVPTCSRLISCSPQHVDAEIPETWK